MKKKSFISNSKCTNNFQNKQHQVHRTVQALVSLFSSTCCFYFRLCLRLRSHVAFLKVEQHTHWVCVFLFFFLSLFTSNECIDLSVAHAIMFAYGYILRALYFMQLQRQVLSDTRLNHLFGILFSLPQMRKVNALHEEAYRIGIFSLFSSINICCCFVFRSLNRFKHFCRLICTASFWIAIRFLFDFVPNWELNQFRT